MKIITLITFLFSLFAGSHAFQVSTKQTVSVIQQSPVVSTEQPQSMSSSNTLVKVLPIVAASLAAAPVYAAGTQEMSASFLPAIMTPLVGLVFPGLSMALFFLYTQYDDLDNINN